MSLLTLRDIEVGFGGPPLLEGINLQIERGERLCLIGRNGMGKSTLMKLISGQITPDAGEIQRTQGLRTAYLPQEVPRGLSGSVYDVVAGGLGQLGSLLSRYHHLSAGLGTGAGGARLRDLEEVQQLLETQGGWAVAHRVESVLSRLGVPADTDFAALSGGLMRRALLGRALVAEPDLLLLDEPTNHLDIPSIQWLETFMAEFGGTILFVTHDRMFIRRLATRIVALDRGRLTSWPGNYDLFLQRREAALAAEAAQDALFDKRLAREEAWIRQGVKARRTRNEGRVRSLQAMREERRARRLRMGKAQMQINDVELSGKRVVEARGISYAREGRTLVKDFSTTVLRGDKVGILGPNGIGKTTLLKLLLGELRPDTGRVIMGTRLEPVYFDQLRGQLNEEKTVLENATLGGDNVVFRGRTRHVIGYLQDFLFSPERVRAPVKTLSGGERNRLLLARLFSRPANLIVMDEPTNDLDVETLELLEELLVDYEGTLLLVSHDREFVNNVVTSTLVFEQEGVIREYVGGYDDWLRQRPQPAKEAPSPAPALKARARPRAQNKGLSYNEQRELTLLPGRIEELEARLQDLSAALSDPAFYKDPGNDVAAATRGIESLQEDLAEAYRRWEDLESRQPSKGASR